MRVIKSHQFTADKAWGAQTITVMNGISTRLHWTDEPYIWHTNVGKEVFVVLDGAVDMYYRDNGQEHSVRLNVGDIFYASIGTEHVAHPIKEARILVIENEDSI